MVVASLMRFIKIKLAKIMPISMAKIRSKNTVKKKVVKSTMMSIRLLLSKALKFRHSLI